MAAEYSRLNEESRRRTVSSEGYGTADADDGNSHRFELYNFKSITICSVCEQMLWGFHHQGLTCKDCDMSVHRRCESSVTGKCRAAVQQVDLTVDAQHKFLVHNYKVPSFCSHCGSMLFGFYAQGLKCGDCNRNVHHKCEEKISHHCDAHHD